MMLSAVKFANISHIIGTSLKCYLSHPISEIDHSVVTGVVVQSGARLQIWYWHVHPLVWYFQWFALQLRREGRHRRAPPPS